MNRKRFPVGVDVVPGGALAKGALELVWTPNRAIQKMHCVMEVPKVDLQHTGLQRSENGDSHEGVHVHQWMEENMEY
jgi:hypothetical protein